MRFRISPSLVAASMAQALPAIAAGPRPARLLVEQNDLASARRRLRPSSFMGTALSRTWRHWRLVREALGRAPRCCCAWRRTSSVPCVLSYRASRIFIRYYACDWPLPLRSTRRPRRFCRRHVRSISLIIWSERRSNDATWFGFEYSDFWVDDGTSGHSQRRRRGRAGAVIRTRPAVCGRSGTNPGVLSSIPRVSAGGHARFSSMQLVVVASVANRPACAGAGPGAARQGSHIVVPRLFEHDRGYLPANIGPASGVCASVRARLDEIGTTDADYAGDPAPRADPGRDQLSLRQCERIPSASASDRRM